MPKQDTLEQLKKWQAQQAEKEGVEGFRVVPFSTLTKIALAAPQTKEELCAVKGFKEARFRKYGRAILNITGGKTKEAPMPMGSLFEESSAVNKLLEDNDYDPAKSLRSNEANNSEGNGSVVDEHSSGHLDTDVLSVSDFIAALNDVLQSQFAEVRIKGEVIGFKRNANGHAYFELKDDHSIMRCAVFRDSFELSGVAVADGMELIVTGHPQHHEKYGFSFIGSIVEHTGEGALKKAYEALKKKLESEGLFAKERKRLLPELPQRIGLITSKHGAAIHDFLTNVGQYGFHIVFASSSVEGAKAVRELLQAMKQLEKQKIDLLVMTRGGGSLESLQAYNNEKLVRAIAEFPVPVVCGIGHEQDETLATLVADYGASTPTAAARTVRQSWDEALQKLEHKERLLLDAYENVLVSLRNSIDGTMQQLVGALTKILSHFRLLCQKFLQYANGIAEDLSQWKEKISLYEKTLAAHNPERQLQLGYSIARSRGKIIKSVSDVKKSDKIDVQVRDGNICTTIDSVHKL